MKSENVIRSPLLLFNFSLLTQYVLLFFCLKTKRNILIPLLLLFNFYILTIYLFLPKEARYLYNSFEKMCCNECYSFEKMYRMLVYSLEKV
jgi:hypothetical protein